MSEEDRVDLVVEIRQTKRSRSVRDSGLRFDVVRSAHSGVVDDLNPNALMLFVDDVRRKKRGGVVVVEFKEGIGLED